MEILIDLKDAVVVNFWLSFGAKQLSDVFFIDGGGNKQIACWASDSSEMEKKTFSLSEGKCNYQVPNWCPSLDDKVVLVLNRDKLAKIEKTNLLSMLKRMTQGWVASKKLRSRGGGIVFEKLSPTGRVIEKKIPLQGSNLVIKELTGLEEPAVYYGTTDAANVFELLQVLKSSEFLGLPGVYDTYSFSHTIGDYWKRVLEPSLKLFGEVDFSKFPMNASDKMTSSINTSLFADGLRAHGLSEATQVIDCLKPNLSFASLYRKGMQFLVDYVSATLELNTFVKVVETEKLIARSVLGNWNLGQIGNFLERQAGHSVVVANLDDSTQIKSDATWPYSNLSIDQLHQKGGWLGGAALYTAVYSVGMEGPIVMLVKDSKAGLVHMSSLPYLSAPYSTYLLPVGLVRISANNQPVDASIDPFVFLELLMRNSDPKALLLRIFEAMEVPLRRDSIGTKTLITMGLDDLNINRVMDT